MKLSADLAIRAWNWISDSPNDGHAYSCRAMDKLMEFQGSCNCGRDALLSDLAAAAVPPEVLTNGVHA